MLEHGGRLLEAARRHGIEPARWLDLSTGINPHAYPVGTISAEAWRRLPEAEDGLIEAARRYYGIGDALADHIAIVPIAGTQAAIQALPRVLMRGFAQRGARSGPPGEPLRVSVATLTYNEYAHAWQRAGHAVTAHDFSRLPDAAAQSDIVMLCQPNNPTGARLSIESLHAMLASLRSRSTPHQGCLIVDEAYMDTTPGGSLLRSVNASDWAHLIVLRSVGKFFGLAGARAGFAMGSPGIMQGLNEELGPWALSGPTRAAVSQALRDEAWQVSTRAVLQSMAAKLDTVLHQRLGIQATGTTLFRWFEHPRSAALHAHLASAAILVRQFATPVTGGLPSLRLGLPVDGQQLARLDAALETFT